VVGDDVLRQVEPQRREPVSTFALVRDLGRVDDVIGGDAIRGDHQQVTVELVELAHLAAGDEGGHPA
jgi:hypothetical protein